MPAQRLSTRCVEKPWGRRNLPPGFERFERGGPVGEVWFDAPDHELLVKYLFTGERLSVQVHPDDDQAKARGFPRGKDEAWLVLDAPVGGVIALGPKNELTRDELVSATLDGSIVEMLHWKRVAPGDFIYSPARTLHTIGPGLTLVEIQQNSDVTYRLYDHGRTRELHLNDAVAVASLIPFEARPGPLTPGLLCEGTKFVVERLGCGERALSLTNLDALLIPIKGSGSVDEHIIAPGECWRMTGQASLMVGDQSEVLLTYSGPSRR